MALATVHKVIISVIAIPVAMLLVIILFWDANMLKDRVETHTENVQGHSISFGNLEHSLLSPGKLAVQDITINGHIANGTIEEVALQVDVSQALGKRLVVHEVVMQNTDLEVDMEKLKAYLESQAQKPETEPAADQKPLEIPLEIILIEAIRLNNINIKDVSEKQQFAVQGIDIAVDDMLVVDNFNLVALEHEPPVQARVSVGQIEAMQVPLGKLQGEFALSKDLVDINQLELDTGTSFIGLSGSLANLKSDAQIDLKLAPSKVSFDEFQPLLGDLPILPSGALEMSGNINTTGALTEPKALLQTLTGDIELGLNQGKLVGIDINEIVTSFKDSKETDLKDIGGFLITGPVGLIASNLFDLGSGAGGLEGETLIPQMKLKGAMEQGKLVLSDTALATDQYRLAFDGGLDPNAGTFNDFTFALLDEAGCATLTQTLNGDMSQPTSAIAESLLDTALSPLTGLLNAVKDTVQKCEPFYQGEVAHPVN